MAGPEAPDSEIHLRGKVTTKGQKSGEASVEWSPGGGRFYFKSKVGYSDFARLFWGVGPEAPLSAEEVVRPRETLVYQEAFWNVSKPVKAGVRYEFEETRYLDVEPTSLIATAGYGGAEGGRVSGSGLLAELDTRDRRHSPTSGFYHQAFALIFDEALGSDYDFNNYNVDLRSYLSPADGHVLATQFFLYSARGEAPLWRYAELGGRAHSRGYRVGRYRDRLLLSAQVEYRVAVAGRFGLAGFAGIADVAPEYDGFRLDHVRPTLGGGVRVRIRKNDPLKARLDVAAGDESVRLYFGFDEAF